MLVPKVRLRFAKRGDLRLISHHDLLRCLERLLRRAAIPMAYSQGFNPRPKLSFPLALGLGIEARREPLELELAEPMEPEDVLRRLRAAAPPGFDFLEAEAVGPGRSPRVVAVQYQMDVPPDLSDAARARLAAFLASDHWTYLRRRPDRTVEADLRPFVLSGELDPGGILRFRMRIAPDGSARPEEVLDALDLRTVLGSGGVLVRTDVELA
jgi:radical SAM-linked protein